MNVIDSLLENGVVWVAVVTVLWVWDGHGLAVNEGESLVEIWAVLEAVDVSSDLAKIMSVEFTLMELVFFAAVVQPLVSFWCPTSRSWLLSY